MLAGMVETLQQFDEFVGILVRDETVRPERQRLVADSDGLDVVEARFQQRLQVCLLYTSDAADEAMNV